MATANDSTTVDSYIANLPAERMAAVTKLRKTILKNIPKGYSESFAFGMIAYSVPHSIFPEGYHCNPSQPLPFLMVANQKNFIALYHMGIYAEPKLLKWFTDEFPNHATKKLDMGKSCIRFKDMEDIPYELIGELMKKMTVQNWIDTYQAAFRSSKPAKK
ncbi:MAG: DUF1801 domain-containing protein [Chitinophagaceae bacterium]|nr:MAG: DUF1801 domain-containing protein [Chitinophagaceae bacterium]